MEYPYEDKKDGGRLVDYLSRKGFKMERERKNPTKKKYRYKKKKK